MSEVKKIATRESYGNALVEIGKEHEDLVVLDADLAGATKTAIFQKVFPERHIDCGIAEGNMMGVAAFPVYYDDISVFLHDGFLRGFLSVSPFLHRTEAQRRDQDHDFPLCRKTA